MTVTQVLLDTLDATARSLGPTPRYDINGRVVPIGNPRSDGKVFVVWQGRAIGLFYGLRLANAMVFEFEGAAYQGCRNLEDAQITFRRGPTYLRDVWNPPLPRAAIPTPAVARPDVSEGNYTPEELAYDQNDPSTGDLSNIGAQVNTPPSIRIIQDRAANEHSRLLWESMVEQCPPGAVRVAPSVSAVSGMTGQTASWRTVGTPAISSWGTTTWTGSSIAARSERGHGPPSDFDSASSDASSGGAHTGGAGGTGGAGAGGAGAGGATAGGAGAGGAGAGGPGAGGPGVFGPIHENDVVAWAVVRGRHPGVYKSRRDADIAGGYATGIKVVAFTRRTDTFVYFVQKYMKNLVGRPVDVEE